MIAPRNTIPQINHRCPGVDEHTVALWLFDEIQYANLILTDAGPLQLDLRLSSGRDGYPEVMAEGRKGIVEGKFGRALHLPIADDVWVDDPDMITYLQRGICMSQIMETGGRTRTHNPPALDRGPELPERCNLGNLDFTIELWFRACGEQIQRGVLWSIRNRSMKRCFNSLTIEPERKAFKFVSLGSYWNIEIFIPTDLGRINDGEWHHLAFTFTASEKQVRHYVDGILQKLPEPDSILPLIGVIHSMTIGNDTDGKFSVYGVLDEFRISDTVRYKDSFVPPGSFSRNYGHFAPQPAESSGPPLLFTSHTHGPVPLGNRRHLFIDDALVEKSENAAFTVNPPLKIDVTDFRATNSWEHSTRLGPMIPDICSVWDDGDRLGMMYGNNGQMSEKYTTVSLAWSEDGVHWVKPELGVMNWEGSVQNNIVLRNAVQGTVIRDTNPRCLPEEKYKMAAWTMNRGFHMFTSQDAARWYRNETHMFPFDPDGSIEIFWDDQKGCYRGYSRALMGDDFKRNIIRSESNEIYKPWSFMPSNKPRWHEKSEMGMPRPCSGELPLVNTGGEVYRMKAHKYSWAPDVYVAFPWRFIREQNVRPGSFLEVSRDGDIWKVYDAPYYFGSGWELNGREVIEGLMEQGMVKRGNEIWQFGTVRFTEHGGAMLGGVEHDGGYFDRFVRLTQRLDGFVSLDSSGASAGTILTKIFTFSGLKLCVNANVQGRLRVEIQDIEGHGIKGFELNECEPVCGDNTCHFVQFKSGRNPGELQGQPVRLYFELFDSKLYSFEFINTVIADTDKTRTGNIKSFRYKHKKA